MNLAVLIFLKTYACKQESKHKRLNIEPKPTQKNWPRVTSFFYYNELLNKDVERNRWVFKKVESGSSRICPLCNNW